MPSFWGGAEDLQRRGRGIRPAQGHPQLGRILGGYGDVAVRSQYDVQGNSLSTVGEFRLLQGKMKDNGLIDFTYEVAPHVGLIMLKYFLILSSRDLLVTWVRRI